MARTIIAFLAPCITTPVSWIVASSLLAYTLMMFVITAFMPSVLCVMFLGLVLVRFLRFVLFYHVPTMHEGGDTFHQTLLQLVVFQEGKTMSLGKRRIIPFFFCSLSGLGIFPLGNWPLFCKTSIHCILCSLQSVSYCLRHIFLSDRYLY